MVNLQELPMLQELHWETGCMREGVAVGSDHFLCQHTWLWFCIAVYKQSTFTSATQTRISRRRIPCASQTANTTYTTPQTAILNFLLGMWCSNWATKCHSWQFGSHKVFFFLSSLTTGVTVNLNYYKVTL